MQGCADCHPFTPLCVQAGLRECADEFKSLKITGVRLLVRAHTASLRMECVLLAWSVCEFNVCM